MQQWLKIKSDEFGSLQNWLRPF